MLEFMRCIPIFFESNELEHLNEVEDLTAFEVYQEYGEFIDPYDHEDPMFYLAYFLNQIADYFLFLDGRQAGDENYNPAIPGLEDVISSLENQLEPNDLNAGNCIDMYNVLIPYAIKATAGLLYWLAVESGQIEPIPEPWHVSGTVGTSDAAVPDEITVHFEKLNSEHNFTINADENGFFSRLFCYRESGLYNLEIRKDGYYPAVFSNLNINTELDLGK